MMEALQNDELLSGRGLNQETNFKHSGGYTLGFILWFSMVSSTFKVIEMNIEDGTYLEHRGEDNFC